MHAGKTLRTLRPSLPWTINKAQIYITFLYRGYINKDNIVCIKIVLLKFAHSPKLAEIKDMICEIVLVEFNIVYC